MDRALRSVRVLNIYINVSIKNKNLAYEKVKRIYV